MKGWMKDGCESESSLEDYLKQKKKDLGCEIFSFEIHSILLRKITIFNL